MLHYDNIYTSRDGGQNLTYFRNQSHAKGMLSGLPDGAVAHESNLVWSRAAGSRSVPAGPVYTIMLLPNASDRVEAGATLNATRDSNEYKDEGWEQKEQEGQQQEEQEEEEEDESAETGEGGRLGYTSFGELRDLRGHRAPSPSPRGRGRVRSEGGSLQYHLRVISSATQAAILTRLRFPYVFESRRAELFIH
eukprot:COSAG01_NODE_6118_length_3842_cov_3.927064_4_plen_193_part_00